MTDKKLKVLVCVSGMSPAVITETLYELVRENIFIPDEIHVITTLEGMEEIKKKLFGKDGAMGQFISMYLPGKTIIFDESTIHVPKDENDSSLEDITTVEHNQLVANTTYAVMRQLKDRKAQIHASIAGGRKTMSFYMGQAFSLVAENDDKLSHVLVSPPFERIGDFYFPTLPKKMHTYKEKDRSTEVVVEKSVCSSTAKISLADVAVLKLGAMWEENLPDAAKKDLSFAIKIAQAVYEPPDLIISEKRNKNTNEIEPFISVMGVRIPLSRQELLVYMVIAYERYCGLSIDNQGFDVSVFDSMRNDQSPVEKTYFYATAGHDAGRAAIKTINSDIKSKLSKYIGPASKWFVISKSIRKIDDHHYRIPLDPSKIVDGLTSDTQEKIKNLLEISRSKNQFRK